MTTNRVSLGRNDGLTIACLVGALIVCHACARSPIALPATARSAADVNDVLVGVRSPTQDSVSLARFQPDLPAVDGPFTCAGRERLSPDARAVYASFPTVADSRATVVVMLDSIGKPLDRAARVLTQCDSVR